MRGRLIRLAILIAAPLASASGCGLVYDYDDYGDQPGPAAGAGGGSSAGNGGADSSAAGAADTGAAGGQGGSAGGQGGNPGTGGQGGNPGTGGQDGGSGAGAQGGADAGDDAPCTPVSCPEHHACINGTCQPALRMFVTTDTSGLQGWNVGSVEQADSLCTTYKNQVPLNGTFRAWVSGTADGGAVSTPSTWAIAQTTAWFVLVDGTPVAHGWAQLTSGALEHAVDENVHGQMMTPACVWTGTKADGTATGNNCHDWSSNLASVSGTTGYTGSTEAEWSNRTLADSCDNHCQIYCVEQ